MASPWVRVRKVIAELAWVLEFVIGVHAALTARVRDLLTRLARDVAAWDLCLAVIVVHAKGIDLPDVADPRMKASPEK